MAQGIYVNGKRPKSKKAIREALSNGERVRIEATSILGNEYDGMVEDAPEGTYYFVGPDPYAARNFYGQVIVKGGKITIK